MKMRKGFVSNSSSSSFILTNLTGEEKNLVDFVKDNPQLFESYVKNGCNWHDYALEEIIGSASEYDKSFLPGEEVRCFFTNEGGDEAETMLRHILEVDGDKTTDKWSWVFEYNDQAGDYDE